jgi:hypothetical protein
MIEIVRRIVVRLALCALLSWAAWHLGLGAGTLVVVALFGIALARPLVDLASELRHQYRRAHWRDREGRHYVFRGRPLSVHEDAEHRRWVRLADVRSVVGFTASDASLKLTYANGWRLLGRPPEPHLSDEALIAHLSKERSATALKFVQWAEREIAFPARRQRERLGIRADSPDFRASD